MFRFGEFGDRFGKLLRVSFYGGSLFFNLPTAFAKFSYFLLLLLCFFLLEINDCFDLYLAFFCSFCCLQSILLWPPWSDKVLALQMAISQILQKNLSSCFSWCSSWQNAGRFKTFLKSSSWKSFRANALCSLLALIPLRRITQSAVHQNEQHWKQ